MAAAEQECAPCRNHTEDVETMLPAWYNQFDKLEFVKEVKEFALC